MILRRKALSYETQAPCQWIAHYQEQQKQMGSKPGTYVLILASSVFRQIQVGSVGELRVKPGFYAYVGSAFGWGGLVGRLLHHLAIGQHPHWHIDHLRTVTRLEEIWYSYDDHRREHQWSDLLGRSRGASTPMIGFGASDCRCESHLFFFPERPSFSGFCRRARGAFPGHGTIRIMTVPS